MAAMNFRSCTKNPARALVTHREFAQSRERLQERTRTDGDLTLQQVGTAPECAVSTAPSEDPFIRDERGNPLMVKGTEAPEEAATKVANQMNHAG